MVEAHPILNRFKRIVFLIFTKYVNQEHSVFVFTLYLGNAIVRTKFWKLRRSSIHRGENFFPAQRTTETLMNYRNWICHRIRCPNLVPSMNYIRRTMLHEAYGPVLALLRVVVNFWHRRMVFRCEGIISMIFRACARAMSSSMRDREYGEVWRPDSLDAGSRRFTKRKKCANSVQRREV